MNTMPVSNRRPGWARMINRAGSVLERAGVLGGLAEEDLLRAARRKTGLSDFGDDAFRAPMRALLDSFLHEAGSDLVGRLIFRMWCVDLLVNRLRIQAEVAAHPEIRDIPIARPLFVIGLPRTGTTLLYNLLALQPDARPLMTWEMLSPVPPRRTGAADPRLGAARRFVRALLALSPEIQVAHPLDATGSEEDNGLLQNAFATHFFSFMVNVPRYKAFLDQQDMVGAYRYHRLQLQLLSGGRGYWLLKAPAHLYALDALLRVYPDAAIVMTQRPAREVVPSLCSLTQAFRRVFSPRVDPLDIGRHWMTDLPRLLQTARAARDAAPERFLEVDYRDLMRDPQGVVRRVHERFGYPLDPAPGQGIARWLADNPQHKHGVHRYDLATFGLDAGEIERRLAA